MTLFLYLQFGQVVELNPDKHLQSTTQKTAIERNPANSRASNRRLIDPY